MNTSMVPRSAIKESKSVRKAAESLKIAWILIFVVDRSEEKDPVDVGRVKTVFKLPSSSESSDIEGSEEVKNSFMDELVVFSVSTASSTAWGSLQKQQQ